jgi:hypothetical protein
MKKGFLFLMITVLMVLSVFLFAGSASAIGPKVVDAHRLTCDASPQTGIVTSNIYYRTQGVSTWPDNPQGTVAGDLGKATPFDLLSIITVNGNYEICATYSDSSGNESGPSNIVPFVLNILQSPQNLIKE